MNGEQLKQAGMDQAIENADRRVFDWSMSAYSILKDFLKKHNLPFMAEDVRNYASRLGLEEPPSKRSWGSLIVKAKKEGLIKFIKYSQVSNSLAHRANASVWIRK